MEIKTSKIVELLNTDFPKKYTVFSSIVENGVLWEEIIAVVKDADLMNKIIFANDVLLMPPVQSYILINIKNLSYDLTEREKQSIGAVWAFVFKEVFEYKEQKLMPCYMNIIGINSATRYFKNLEKIKVIEG